MLKPWNFEGASCWGIDTEMFFPEDRNYSPENVQAKKVCQSCIYIKECLTYALHYQVLGIWGGTSMMERQALRKKLNIIPRPITNERHTA